MSRRKKKKKRSLNPGEIDYEQMIRDVAKYQMATKDIPAIVAKELKKGWKQLPNTDANRGPKAWFHDPLALQYSLGYKDRRFSLTYDLLRRVAGQLGILSAIINTRSAQVASFAQPYRWTKSLGFVIRHKDPEHMTTPAETEFIKELENFILNCGRLEKNPYSRQERDDFEGWLRKIVRDTLTLDQIGTEIVYDYAGLPFEFYAVDAATIRIAADDRYVGVNTSWTDRDGFVPHTPQRFGNLWAGQRYGHQPSKPVDFVQVVNGQIENVWSRDELMFGVRNPRTDIYMQGYGYGEIEQALTIITSHLFAEQYNVNFFKQGCVAGDTPVHTAKGIIPIEELTETGSFKVWNGHTWVVSDAVFSGYKPAVNVRLQNNFQITTSPDHKFLTIGVDGRRKMKPISEMQVGDLIAQAQEEVLEFESEPVSVQRTDVKHQLRDAGKLDEEFYEFVGFLVGAGYISKTKRSQNDPYDKHNYNISCVFGPSDAAVKDTFAAMLRRRGFSFYERKSGGEWGGNPIDTLTIRNSGLFNFLTNVVGMSTEKAQYKTVPSRIFKESAKNRSAFLRGYFSADGFVKKGIHAYVCSSSQQLIEGTQQLLWSLGISSAISHTLINASGNPCYYLRVSNNAQFRELVGFMQPYKELQPRTKDTVGKCPRAVQNAIFRDLQGKDLEKAKVSQRSTNQLRDIAARHNKHYDELVYRWTKIVSIEETGIVVPMYDIRQTDSRHQWSAGGCITSNSAPKGMINIKGDAYSPEEMEGLQRQWMAQVSGVENAWRTPFFQAENGLEWIELSKSNSEMEFGKWLEYLIKILCGVYLIDPAELNFDLHGGTSQQPMFESSQEWKLKASRDRGLKPLLRFIAKMINKHIIDKIDDHFTLEFVGLDELSEQEKHEMLVEQIASYMTLNEARRTLDLPDVVGGDVPLNPVYLQALETQGLVAPPEQAGEAPPAGPGQGGDGAPSGPKYTQNFGFDNQGQ